MACMRGCIIIIIVCYILCSLDFADLYDEIERESEKFSVDSEPWMADFEGRTKRNISNSNLTIDLFLDSQNIRNISVDVSPNHEATTDQPSHWYYGLLDDSEHLRRCSKCERKGNEAVCGRNGQTYPTLCHAVNCGRLSLDDITFGDCNTKVCCEMIVVKY